MSSSSRKPIYVIGSGIIGLTTAIKLAEAGSTVKILAAHLPEDPPHPAYASTAAGAHHLSFAADDDLLQRYLDAKTFEIMWAEVERDGQESGLMKLLQTEYYDGEEKHLEILSGLPNFKIRHPSTYPPFATHSVSFSSLTMTPSVYLPRLVEKFKGLGGEIHRAYFTHINQAIAHFPGVTPRAVVLCTGIGALNLGGLSDQEVFPTRGQVVVLNAPWCKNGFTYQIGSLSGGEGGDRTYVIPRMNGEVVIGGTRGDNDWEPNAREETTTDILKRALAICPQLLKPGTTERSPEALRPLITKVVVGYRPNRRNGLRLEKLEKLIPVVDGSEASVEVIAAYGHSGAGWQSCWGTAEVVRELLGGGQRSPISEQFARAAGTSST